MHAVRIGIGLVVLVLAAAPTRAQQAPATPTDASLTVHGSVNVGYRSATVSGSTDMYRRMFDVSDGPRLMNVELRGDGRGTDLFADTFAFSAGGIGDPFPTVQFTMRKAQRYDLRVNWRKSRFVDTWPLTPASIAGL